MRVLIDESLPRQLAIALKSHDARMVKEMGWSSLKNGELLRRASESGFDAFVTADRNLEFQQNVSRVDIAVLVLVTPTTQVRAVLALASRLLEVLETAPRRAVTRVGV